MVIFTERRRVDRGRENTQVKKVQVNEGLLQIEYNQVFNLYFEVNTSREVSQIDLWNLFDTVFVLLDAYWFV